MMNAGILGKGWILAALFVVITSTGCSLGPQVMKGNRLDYNVSIQKSNNEELLLNIVRARYFEPLFFLQVGSISSSFGYSSTAGLSGTFFERAANQSYLNYLTPSLGAGFSENPTITYSPLQGEKMVRQLQSEISLERFLTMVRTGFRIDGMMWLTVLQIGDVGNFRVSEGKDDKSISSYSKFLDLAQMLGKIQQRRDMELTGVRKKEGESDCITMQLCYLDRQEAEDVEKLLGVHPERLTRADGRTVSVFELTAVRDFMSCQGGKANCSRVYVKLKSYQQIIYDMAMHVEITDDAQSAKSAIPFTPPTGEVALRDGIHAGLVKVKSQLTKPANAFVAVSYRDKWFYIDDDDLKTKLCFMILSSMYSLQSGDLPATASPVLTLPVSR